MTGSRWRRVGVRMAMRLYAIAARTCGPPLTGAWSDDWQRAVTDTCDAAAARGGLPALVTVFIAELWDVFRVALRHRLALWGVSRPPLISTGRAPRRGERVRKGVLAMWIDDLRHALRRLRSQPSTAMLAAAMLALAIGISSAMFTVVDSLILRPAPFPHPETLAMLSVGPEGKGLDVNLRLPTIKALRDSHGFASVYAVIQEPSQFGSGDTAEPFVGVRVTPGIFEELGAHALMGRTFISGEGRAGNDAQMVIGELLWRSRFGADPAIVGRQIDIGGKSVQVVGVLPASFAFPFSNVRVWRPIDLDQLPALAGRLAGPNALGYAYARLDPKLPPAETARLAADAAQQVAASGDALRVGLEAIDARYLDEYSAGTVKVLAAGVGLVFLVLCANVTNLMLARLGARRREFALSSALGASRGRLLRQAFCEQLVIGGVASAIGLALAAGLVAIARAYLPDSIVSSTLNPLAVDVRAVVGTSVFGALAVVIAGVLPAWIGTSETSSRGLQIASRSATPTRRARTTTSVLLIGEVAFAVALSVAAGLQMRSFVNLLHEDRGLDADHLITFRIAMPAANFADGASRYVYAESLRTKLLSRPGIAGVTLSSGTPPGAGAIHFYDVLPDTSGATPVKLVMNGYYVAPEFFDVYGIRLIEGRSFQPGDSPDTVVISRSMAAALWPTGHAAGHSLSFVGSRTFQVVGVVSEILNPLRDPRQDRPELYEPLLAAGPGDAAPALTSTAVNLTVRCVAACPPTEAMRADIKTAAARATVGPGKRIADEYVAALARPETGAVVAVAFAGIGLLAVGCGLFAVLSRVVLQRQREFGIRVALGATPGELRRLVHASGMFVAIVGLAIGVGVAWALSRLLASVQYQVVASDPLTWTLVIATVTLTVFAASWRPARVAMRADPLALLRED